MDTSVLLPLLDREGVIETERKFIRAAQRFFSSKVEPFPNIIVKVHFLTVAELVNLLTSRTLDIGDARLILDEFFDIKNRLRERLQLCPVKHLGQFIPTLGKFIERNRQLTDQPVDVMILVTATLDQEATKLYTRDKKLLLSEQVRRLVAEIRRDKGMGDLRIENPLEP